MLVCTPVAPTLHPCRTGCFPGAGGYGADWGVRYDSEGQLVAPREDRGPLFQGPEGQQALRAAVLEYAPLWQVGTREVRAQGGCHAAGRLGREDMSAAGTQGPAWLGSSPAGDALSDRISYSSSPRIPSPASQCVQNIMFQLADKPGDPDPMDWSPAGPAGGLPCAIGFLQQQQANGSGAAGTASATSRGVAPSPSAAASAPLHVRLDALWGLPGQWEVLHAAALQLSSSGGEAALVALDRGLAVAGLLVEVVRYGPRELALPELRSSAAAAVGRVAQGRHAVLNAAPVRRVRNSASAASVSS